MADVTQDDIALAAEYTLGLLDMADHATASARVATNADFAAEVEAWRVRLQPLLGGTDTPVPDHVWHAIAAKLPAPAVQDNIRGRLRFWQMTSLGSGALAAILAGLLFLQPKPVAQTPVAPMVAALGSDSGTASLTVRYDSNSGDMLLTPVSLKTGKLYPELWIIPADGKARSLGIVTGDHATQMVVPADMRVFMEQGATLAITPEPAGGAPGGKATGPILASGKIIPV
jgi:anti-sigma-K factor RskA